MWLIVPISNDDCALSGDEDETYEEKLRVGGEAGKGVLGIHESRLQRAEGKAAGLGRPACVACGGPNLCLVSSTVNGSRQRR